MPVLVTLDKRRLRVTVCVSSGEIWPSFHKAVSAAIEERPFLTSLHWIIDDNAPMTDVSIEGLASLTNLFRDHSGQVEPLAVTVVAVSGRDFGAWAHLLQPRYGGRQYIGAACLEEAQEVLDRIDLFRGAPPSR